MVVTFFLSAINPLATIDAALNALATVLLVAGFILIKRGRVTAHKRTMLTAFAVSILFLCCYLAYHLTAAEPVHFPGPASVRPIYLAILIPHVILAATIPFSRLPHNLPGPERPPRRAPPLGPLDVADLALRVGHRRDRLSDAVSSLSG